MESREIMQRMNATLHKVEAILCIFAPKTTAALLCQDTKGEKMAAKITELNS